MMKLLPGNLYICMHCKRHRTREWDESAKARGPSEQGSDWIGHTCDASSVVALK